MQLTIEIPDNKVPCFDGWFFRSASFTRILSRSVELSPFPLQVLSKADSRVKDEVVCSINDALSLGFRGILYGLPLKIIEDATLKWRIVAVILCCW
ncbi:hypothetical protein [Runella salmonicolor]|uniref:Uncharacterized protein n=1 Tax=Runella salmonicolor TaxID=2950278 RepID=A0ABT1FNM0_9BACT|nr:hypothetical protein [Runella salmonicolor]MCP1383365.1 hypothetical protein [Runella salmonicolor]